MEGARALLGVLGLTAGGQPTPVEVDLHEYGPALSQALLARIEAEHRLQATLEQPDPTRGEAQARIAQLDDLLARAEEGAGVIGHVSPGEDLLTLALGAAHAHAPGRSGEESEER